MDPVSDMDLVPGSVRLKREPNFVNSLDDSVFFNVDVGLFAAFVFFSSSSSVWKEKLLRLTFFAGIGVGAGDVSAGVGRGGGGTGEFRVGFKSSNSLLTSSHDRGGSSSLSSFSRIGDGN